MFKGRIVPNGEKLFHSRIFRIYLEYLRIKLFWSETDILQFLNEIGVDLDRIMDDSTWFDAEFADRFYDSLSKRTRDPDLAYEAGRFIHQEAFSPLMHGLIRGLVDVGMVYRLITRFSSHFTKATHFNNIRVSGRSASVDAISLGAFQERAYMCENRRGMLAGVPLIFGLPSAEIEETECMHRGGKKCSYHLKWQEQSSLIDVVRFSFLTITLFTCVTCISNWKFGFLAAFSTLTAGTMVVVRKRLNHQRDELLNHNQMLDQVIKKLEQKNQELALVSQVAQMTHSLTSPEILFQTVVKNVCEKLNYDRAVLLLADLERQVLRVVAHFGFTAELQDLLTQTEFTIRQDNSAGFFIRVINTKAPVLISDVSKELPLLSTRSQAFAKKLQTQSFVAVPLRDQEENVLGVLSVDNIDRSKKLGISDQDLLMTLSEHLGIAIHNANMVEELENNLVKLKQTTEQQKNLIHAFQKFVPHEVSADLIHAKHAEDFNRRLAQVRKRAVSILFLDIVGFSRLAEGIPSESVVELLNIAFRYWEPVVSRHGGFVDKFTGDGLLAIFETGENTMKVCLCAQALIESLSDINSSLQKVGYDSISVGIGINFGSAILGTVGSENRVNFTVMGDAVNLASRLQSHTRTLGSNTICTSASVRSRAGEQFRWQDLGRIHLKGFSEGTHAFKLVQEMGADFTNRSAEAPPSIL